MNNLVLRATCFAQSFAAVSKDRRGVTAMEYGLIAALIAVAIVVTVGEVGDNLKLVFEKVRDELSEIPSFFEGIKKAVAR
jgi:pilus assembly protein Flp/PilA